MFGLFTAHVFTDPDLGMLNLARGYWRSAIDLGEGLVPMALAGDRQAPDPAALAEARALRQRMAAWQAPLQAALFAHYRPYAEAVAAGAPLPDPDLPFPVITAPAAVAAHVSLAFVSIVPEAGQWVTELGYAADWDTEYTVGARFAEGRLLELCGSVLKH